MNDLNGHTFASLAKKASANFEIEPAESAPALVSTQDYGVYCEGKWNLLHARDNSFDAGDPTGSIGAAILERNLLEPVLGVENIRTDKRIDFVGGIRGDRELEQLVDSGRHKIAFSLHSVAVEQLLAVADAGQVMPPKSTWFEPKLRSGMVVNLLNE